MSKKEVVGAMAAETEDGDLIALIVLPMSWEAVVDIMEAINKHFPDSMARQATHYMIRRGAE